MRKSSVSFDKTKSSILLDTTTMVPLQTSVQVPRQPESRDKSCMTFKVSSNDSNASSNSPSTKSKQRPRRKVSFSVATQTKLVRHFSDYGRYETELTWFSQEELARIKEDTEVIVDRANHRENRRKRRTKSVTSQYNKEKDKNGCEEEADDSDIRGLESYTKDGAVRIRGARLEAQVAVLYEQRLQQEQGIWDEEMLSRIYRDSSYRCQLAASAIGASDEQVARDIYKQSSQDSLSGQPVPRRRPLLRRNSSLTRRRSNGRRSLLRPERHNSVS
jgi:hypothetical protein